MPNFCPKCGTPCSGANFCSHCGKDLREQEAQTSVPTGDPAVSNLSLDFESLTAEATQTALAISLASFEVEAHGNGKYAILGLKNKNELSLTVPDCVEAIADGAFEGCAAFEITLPEGLLKIGKRAFADAKDLEKINIPSTVKAIGDEAFSGCEQLDLTIPQKIRQGRDVMNNTLAMKKAEETRKAIEAGFCIENGILKAYKGNKTDVVIPDVIKVIGEKAFYENKTVRSVKIPNSVTSIGDSAFSQCSDLTSITIPNSVTSIGNYVFWVCTGLTSITIPNSLTSIGDDAFSYCTGITSMKVDTGNTRYHSSGNCIIETKSKTLIAGCKNSVIPTDGSVTSIGEHAFYRCSGLTSITIPNSLTSIGDEAFSYCTSLTSITIPNSVTSIGDAAFVGCTGLTSITLPNSVTSIGDDAFRGCFGLTSITIPRRFATQHLFYDALSSARITYT